MKKVFREVAPIILAVVCAFLFSRYVFGFAKVPTGSMYPTIEYPAYVIVNHVATELGNVSRGDVVLFYYPDDRSTIFVKRVIGMPGDRIEVHDGQVWVNGRALDETYLNVATDGLFGPFQVPKDQYFMMGDNRQNSLDSRFWQHKTVPRPDIIGKASMQLTPAIKFIQ